MFYTESVSKHPVLMAHHADDECRVTKVHRRGGLIPLPVEESRAEHFITVSGGDTPRSRACGPLSAHGFLGVERETVAAVVEWMNGKTPPEHVGPVAGRDRSISFAPR